MSKSLKSIEVAGHGRVFPVAGMTTTSGVQLVGLFRSAQSARSANADKLAVGTLDRAKASDQVRELADRNAEAM